MMLLGCMFGCADPALTIAAVMATRDPFMMRLDNREAADQVRRHLGADNFSDQLVTLLAFNQWRQVRNERGPQYAYQWASENHLSDRSLQSIQADGPADTHSAGLAIDATARWARDPPRDKREIRLQFASLLADIGFISAGGNSGQRGGERRRVPERMLEQAALAYSSNSGDLQLVRGVIIAGMLSRSALRSVGATANVRGRSPTAVHTAGVPRSCVQRLPEAGRGWLFPNIAMVVPKSEKKRGKEAAPDDPGEGAARPAMKLRSRDMFGFQTTEDGRVALHPRSINWSKKGDTWFPHRWMVYSEKMKTTQLFIRDTTLVTDLGVLLFGGRLSVAPAQPSAQRGPQALVSMKGGYLKWRMDEQVATHVVAVKEQIDTLMALKNERPEVDLREESGPLVRLVSMVLAMEAKPVQPVAPPAKPEPERERERGEVPARGAGRGGQGGQGQEREPPGAEHPVVRGGRACRWGWDGRSVGRSVCSCRRRRRQPGGAGLGGRAGCGRRETRPSDVPGWSTHTWGRRSTLSANGMRTWCLTRSTAAGVPRTGTLVRGCQSRLEGSACSGSAGASR
ncbi:MAG: hypothetical protein WDW38_002910 [Sanguina aurantia]